LAPTLLVRAAAPVVDFAAVFGSFFLGLKTLHPVNLGGACAWNGRQNRKMCQTDFLVCRYRNGR
jgi:hypothetical protein